MGDSFRGNLATYPFDVVRIACPRCGRAGQYRRETLIERFGANAPMLDVLAQIAACERRTNNLDHCQARYPDLAPK